MAPQHRPPSLGQKGAGGGLMAAQDPPHRTPTLQP